MFIPPLQTYSILNNFPAVLLSQIFLIIVLEWLKFSLDAFAKKKKVYFYGREERRVKKKILTSIYFLYIQKWVLRCPHNWTCQFSHTSVFVAAGWFSFKGNKSWKTDITVIMSVWMKHLLVHKTCNLHFFMQNKY